MADGKKKASNTNTTSTAVGAVAPAAEEHPCIAVITKKVRNLRKKLKQIEQLETTRANGAILNEDQLATLGSKQYIEIDTLVMRCYKDIKYCKEALFEINDYQKSAAINKNFSCQTRLLGLEANLIMAMNSNFKRKEAKSIIDSIKKYC